MPVACGILQFCSLMKDSKTLINVSFQLVKLRLE